MSARANVLYLHEPLTGPRAWCVLAVFRFATVEEPQVEHRRWLLADFYALVEAQHPSDALAAAMAACPDLSDERLRGWSWDDHGQRTLCVVPVENVGDLAHMLPSLGAGPEFGTVQQVHVEGRRCLPVFMWR
jgi:hypothetical protein